MCGIVGKILFNNELPSKEEITNATELMATRGPDDEGVWIENCAALGHRRLSILDVTSAGHQPMISGDGRYVIVHNGEVYNFLQLRQKIGSGYGQWKSNTDTETILASYAKWGPDCIKHFNGMFAFAIWDRKKQSLFAARDRIGIKPFYYHHGSAGFSFASRPSSLRKVDPTISNVLGEQALRFYLEIGYIPAPYSIYKHVKKLPPAHYILLEQNELTIKRYWDFSGIQIDNSMKKASESELLDELDEILTRSVHSRLISDVPLGAFLSGGIDSSLVVAIMSKLSSQPVKTFTIGFEEKQYDESLNAAEVANYLGTEHYCETMKVNDLLGLMDNFFDEYDEPFFDHSAFPTMAVSRMARKHVTVSLSGDGGDELFGGYRYYRIVKHFNIFFKLPSVFRKLSSELAGLIGNHQMKLLSEAFKLKDCSSVFAFSRSIAKDFRNIAEPEVLKKTQSIRELFSITTERFPSGLHPGHQGMRLDAFYTLPDDYLQKVDVASMAFSLESRVPLLDHELVKWAMKLPLSWKLALVTDKYLLRKLAYRYIPKQILNRPKRGFGVPMCLWLKGLLKDWANQRFHDKALFENIPLDQKRVVELYNLHLSGNRNVHSLLWAVLVLLEFTARKLNHN